MRVVSTSLALVLLIAGAPEVGRAQSQTCNPDEVGQIRGFLERWPYEKQYMIGFTLDFQSLQMLMDELNSLAASLSPDCQLFLMRLNQTGQTRPQTAPTLGGGGSVLYDEGSDTFYGPGVACPPSGCIPYN